MKSPRNLSLIICALLVVISQGQEGCFQLDSTSNLYESVGGATIFGDIDNDGDQDLIISGYESNSNSFNAKIFINDSLGYFTEQVGVLLPSGVYGGIILEDLDGDSDLDLIITGTDLSSFSPVFDYYFNDGLGNFILNQQAPQQWLIEFPSVASADVDNDGDIDLLVSGQDDFSGIKTNLFENDGLGGFTQVVGTSFLGVVIGTHEFADVNGDGAVDLLLSGKIGGINGLDTTALYFNDGLGGFNQMLNTPFPNFYLPGFSFGDVDGDNDLDLAICGTGSQSQLIRIFQNDGQGSFSELSNAITESFETRVCQFADLDADGDEDLIVTGQTEFMARFFRNDGTGIFSQEPGPFSNSSGATTSCFINVAFGSFDIADVDGDADLDVVIVGDHGQTNAENIKALLYLNNTEQVWFQDVDGDGFGDALSDSLACCQPLGYVADSLDCDDNSFGQGLSMWYADVDGDGYGDLLSDSLACAQPTGYVADSLDCNDNSFGQGLSRWFADVDGDGFGNQLSDSLACAQPAGYVTDSLDCDDNSFGQGLSIWYADVDGDGFGNQLSDSLACAQPTGYVADSLDCNDNSFGQGLSMWYADVDGDGFGDPFAPDTLLCGYQVGYAPTADDCDDTNPALNPGTVPTTTWYLDTDSDGFGNALADSSACFQPNGYVADDTDCDDTDANIGAIQTWYLDGDGDGIGVPFITQTACAQPAGYSSDSTDCNDFDPLVYPGASCNDGDPNSINDAFDLNCNCIGDFPKLAIKAFLEGPYEASTGLMRDDLRAQNLIPLTEPYSALGYSFDNFQQTPIIAGSGATIDPAVLAVTGPNAIVDWVIVELRDATNPSEGQQGVEKSRVALLQRDGDVVELDGISSVSISADNLQYHLCLRHRNHLPAMSSNIQFVGIGISTVDFSSQAQQLYNNMDARNTSNGTLLQAQGDVNNEGQMKYTGAANDRDPILVAIGGNVPTSTLQGVYRVEDINMDGIVKYTGAGNDRDPILVNIGGNVPTTVRVAQLP